MVLVRYGANYTYSINFKMNPRLTHPTKKAPSARLRANIRVHLLIFILVIFLASGKISAFFG